MLLAICCAALLGQASAAGEPIELLVVQPGSETPGPLTLDTAHSLAGAQAPELRIARALVDEARGRMIQAGLYPNPTFGWEGEQLNDRDGRGGQQGPVFGQEIVVGGKLKLDRAAAARALTAAEWNAVGAGFDLRARVGAAFFEVLAAQKEATEAKAIVDVAVDTVKFAEKMQAAGLGSPADVVRAKSEVEATRNRLAMAQVRVDTAWPLLAAAIGQASLSPVELQAEFEINLPALNLESLRSFAMGGSSKVLAALAAVDEARIRRRRAGVENVPNVDLQLHPLYDDTQGTNQLSFDIAFKLPAWNRNQGNIMSANAEISRRCAELRQTELRLAQEIADAFRKYDTARVQADGYHTAIIPAAKESLRLARLAFETGVNRADYTAVLDAQRVYAQARLAYVQAIGEARQALAHIEGIVQRPLSP